jgi:hypothetical protein
MLVQALESHPNITCFSELFNWDVDYVDFNVEGYDNRDPAARALRDTDLRRFLRERIFCERDPSTQTVGFKLLYAHIWGFTGLLPALVDDTDLRVVHLKRRNLLRMLVSTRLAQASGVWRLDGGQPPAPLLHPTSWRRALRHPARAAAALARRLRPAPAEPAPPKKRALSLSAEECKAFFFKAHHQVEHFAGLFAGHPSVEVWYEDLLADRDAGFERVQSFLGVEPRRLSVTLSRQNPEPLSDLIENYEELRAAFVGTPAEPFFG